MSPLYARQFQYVDSIDHLLQLPEEANIGRAKLQVYCNLWLERPIAYEFGITHLIIGSDSMLMVNLDLESLEFVDNRIFIPIYELLDYIIDPTFTILPSGASCMPQHATFGSGGAK